MWKFMQQNLEFMILSLQFVFFFFLNENRWNVIQAAFNELQTLKIVFVKFNILFWSFVKFVSLFARIRSFSAHRCNFSFEKNLRRKNLERRRRRRRRKFHFPFEVIYIGKGRIMLTILFHIISNIWIRNHLRFKFKIFSREWNSRW